MTGLPLAAVLEALTTAVVELVVPPGPGDSSLCSVALLDSDDLQTGRGDAAADLCIHAGVPESLAVTWLNGLSTTPAASGRAGEAKSPNRPTALLSKNAGSKALQQAARQAGMALVGVQAEARSEALLDAVRGLLDLAARRTAGAAEGGPTATDLDGLARTVASLTEGMVSIEDDRSRVLAYSASDGAADQLRILSILGREGPEDYLRRLRAWGVFDRVRSGDEAIEVPADVELGLRRRLVVGIRAPDSVLRSVAQRPLLGTIWVQEGRRPLAADAPAVLRGAAATAARMLARTLNAPSNETAQVQRLLGVRGGSVDLPSLATALGISASGPAVVVGFRRTDGEAALMPEVAAALRLHAGAFARDSLVAALEDRVYVLIPSARAPATVPGWSEGVLDRLAFRPGCVLRAAVAAPVGTLAEIPAARAEVDRVLDRALGGARVTTLVASRTAVLLGEIIDLVAGRPELADPRLEQLRRYDATHRTALVASLATYLDQLGDVRLAAAELHVHPNTLRYRLKRAAEVLEMDLDDPTSRLLLHLQLLAGDRIT